MQILDGLSAQQRGSDQFNNAKIHRLVKGRCWPTRAGLSKDSRYNRSTKNGGNHPYDCHETTTWLRQSRFLLKLLPESIFVLIWCFHGGAKNCLGEVTNVRSWR